MRALRNISCLFITLVIIFVKISPARAQNESTVYLSLFDEICSKIDSNFYDAEFVDSAFLEIKSTYPRELSRVTSRPGFSRIINNMLAELKTSHTHFFTRNDPEFYQLASIFHHLPDVQAQFDHGEISYPSIGMLTGEIAGKIFVVALLSGGEAERAGIVVGDELISADGIPFLQSRILPEQRPKVRLLVRSKASAPPRAVMVQPEQSNPNEEFLATQKASTKIIEKDGLRLGYIRILSYAGEQFHAALVEAITFGVLKEADALIWDLRDGWGGANPTYLDLFHQNVPTLRSTFRGGQMYEYDPKWRKPVVMLINERVRSGKEILAHGCKKFKLATLIGAKTAGATLAGKLFFTSDGSLLYLPVAVTEIDGRNLEGVGIEPDIHVPFDIRYAQGRDPQLERAIRCLIRHLEK